MLAMTTISYVGWSQLEYVRLVRTPPRKISRSSNSPGTRSTVAEELDRKAPALGQSRAESLNSFSPTAGSFGVSAQICSGVVRGGPEVRFHQGSTRVPRGFHQGSTRVPRAAGWCEHYKERRMLLGISPELVFPNVSAQIGPGRP